MHKCHCVIPLQFPLTFAVVQAAKEGIESPADSQKSDFELFAMGSMANLGIGQVRLFIGFDFDVWILLGIWLWRLLWLLLWLWLWLWLFLWLWLWLWLWLGLGLLALALACAFSLTLRICNIQCQCQCPTPDRACTTPAVLTPNCRSCLLPRVEVPRSSQAQWRGLCGRAVIGSCDRCVHSVRRFV